MRDFAQFPGTKHSISTSPVLEGVSATNGRVAFGDSRLAIRARECACGRFRGFGRKKTVRKAGIDRIQKAGGNFENCHQIIQTVAPGYFSSPTHPISRLKTILYAKLPELDILISSKKQGQMFFKILFTSARGIMLRR